MKNPNALIVASEVYLSGIGSLLNNIARNSFTNIKIFDEDVRELLLTLPNKIFDEIYIICPDPWPKARHHKRRLIKQDFLKILVKVLKRDGTVYISTDWENYAESIEEELEKLKSNSIVILIIPLLFEKNYTGLCSEICYIDCPRSMQLKRLQSRDNLSLKEAKQRIDAQWANSFKKQFADNIINNSNDDDTWKLQLKKLYNF